VINKIKVIELTPYPNNARSHSDDQVNQIAASINEFGFLNPVLIDSKKQIMAGHGRVMAAKKLGIEEVPVVIIDHLNEAQKSAYIIADNQIALNADWDLDKLRIEIEHLKEVDFDIFLLGFDDKSVGKLLDDKLDQDDKKMIEREDSIEYNLIVTCKNEMEQNVLYGELISRGYCVRITE
jgi:ParB-like chromosome segregation protein Spo0J